MVRRRVHAQLLSTPSRTEAEALGDRIRTEVRTGKIRRPKFDSTHESDLSSPTELTLADVADRYLTAYARTETRRRHAIRQFEIYIAMLCDSRVPGPGGTLVSSARGPLLRSLEQIFTPFSSLASRLWRPPGTR